MAKHMPNKSLQLTKIPVTNFGTQNVAPGIFATELSVKHQSYGIN